MKKQAKSLLFLRFTVISLSINKGSYHRMALNMYFKNGMIRKTHCQISDDLVPTLYQIHDNANFPQLTWLINNLYDNPQIEPDIATALADEMIAFERLILSLHLPFPMESLQKLQTFFKEAATKEQTIYTSGDWLCYLGGMWTFFNGIDNTVVSAIKGSVFKNGSKKSQLPTKRHNQLESHLHNLHNLSTFL